MALIAADILDCPKPGSPLAYGHLFLTRWISRRSRFVGRPPVSKVRVDAFFSWNASNSRAWRLSVVSSQSVAAAVPDPLAPETPRTTTVWEKGGRRIVMTSPTATTRDRLARSPPRSTFPPSIASAANDRVLKNRAAHSHLSNLTWTLEASSVLDMTSCLSGGSRSAWAAFIVAHLGAIVGLDLFAFEVVTWLGLFRYHVLFAVDIASRKVELLNVEAPCRALRCL
jgi:hypothetical protein